MTCACTYRWTDAWTDERMDGIVGLSVCLPVCLTVCLSVCMYVCMSWMRLAACMAALQKIPVRMLITPGRRRGKVPRFLRRCKVVPENCGELSLPLGTPLTPPADPCEALQECEGPGLGFLLRPGSENHGAYEYHPEEREDPRDARLGAHARATSTRTLETRAYVSGMRCCALGRQSDQKHTRCRNAARVH